MLPDPEESLSVSPETLSAILADRDSHPIRLIDCREQDEFAINKIADAALVALSGFPDAPQPLLASPDPPVVVYCHHGMRSAQAAGFLRHRGITHTFSLQGGIDLWSQEIDPDVPRY